ncbi:hypothetical protein EMPS_07798 [Entomortierella parvispora]|uniref:Uncharacterized protein n=1 Tax=Entomortierella parvispora TaxID=205924 RepID=A0A9P3HF69_9FUNG|nr:hypothetical protein EMPS_07798 [Entomortierella parvispora]
MELACNSMELNVGCESNSMSLFNKFLFEKQVFTCQSAIRTAKNELAISFAYDGQNERQHAKVTIPRSATVEQHPAYQLGMDMVLKKKPRGHPVEIRGF